MGYVDTDNETKRSVEINAQSVKTSADAAPTDDHNNRQIGIIGSCGLTEMKLLNYISERKTCASDKDTEMILNFEMQKKKYDLWKSSGKPPEYISLNMLIEDGREPTIEYYVPFVDAFRLTAIHENYPLRFWACNRETKEREFILFEYTVPRCNFKAVVQDLNANFTIGLNIKKTFDNEYTVYVITGSSEPVREFVQKQLKEDFEELYGNDNSVRTLAVKCFESVKELFKGLIANSGKAVIADLKGIFKTLWGNNDFSHLVNIIGITVTFMVIAIPLWINGFNRNIEMVPVSGVPAAVPNNTILPSVPEDLINQEEIKPRTFVTKENGKRERQSRVPKTTTKSGTVSDGVHRECGPENGKDPFSEKNDLMARGVDSEQVEDSSAEKMNNYSQNSEPLSCSDKLSY